MIWNDIINLIFPAECHICGNPLASHEKFICTGCEKSLPRTGFHRNLFNPMVERFAGHFPFDKASGHFFYSRDSSLSKLFQDMKYRGFSSIGDYLGEIAGSELFSTGWLSEIECIVPLPMHFLKKAKRGYNQTDHICRGLSAASEIPVVQALKMTRQRKTQTALSRLERLENAKGLFKVKKGVDLNNKFVLLVDDVCTTGTTLDAAASTLTTAFPDIHLSLFTLAVTF